MPDTIQLIYCPCSTIDVARELAKQLVAQHLVACCNILPSSESHYLWQGDYQITQEAVLIAKTTTDKLAEAVKCLATHHPYECPAILAFGALANAEFATWAVSQLKD